MAVDWESEKEIFYRALELAPEDQDIFLNEACGSDPAMRVEIERLLSFHARGRTFFQELERELGAFDADTPMFANGEVIAGRFEIQSFLARGGFGEVYKAYDYEIKELVALKALRNSRIAPEAVERFRAEVRLARRIASNHICRVHDVGRFERPGDASVIFFSMELLEGENLSEYRRKHGPMAKPQAFAILRQIAEGLAAAHELGIFHRDLKSANIMLVTMPNGAPRAVITDFGLAITAERTDTCAALAGTPAFMAPEQVNAGDVDARTDVYALGVVAFEMLTGRLPFAGGTAEEQARARLTDLPAKPSVFCPSIGQRWEQAILRCLERDPKKRFASAREFIEALNPPRSLPVLIALALISLSLALATERYKVYTAATSVIPRSVIVLGFDAGDGIEEWQGEALGNELRATLASVPGVRVAAQTASADWVKQPRDRSSLRRQLRVASVLSGNIRRSDGGLRLTAQLVDSSSGYLLWSGTFKVTSKDLPNVEEKVVLASMQALDLQLPAKEVDAVRNRQPQNSDAYQACAYGQYWAGRRNTQALEEAIRSYQKAIDLDPRYSLAYAGLATAYNLIASRGAMPRAEAFRLSNQAAEMALSLDPDLPEAMLVKGSNLQMDSWDWDGAERLFRRCTQVSPGLGACHHWLAGLLSVRGRWQEALSEISEARSLDPLSPSLTAAFGTFLFRARRYEEARAQLEWVVASEPAFLNGKLLLAEIYSQVGRQQDAIKLAEAVSNAEGSASYVLADLGYYYGRGGRIDEGRRTAEELTSRFAQGRARPSEAALVYEGLGEFEVSCDWLERGLEVHDNGLSVLKVDPAWDPLRGNPRFRSLVEKLRL